MNDDPPSDGQIRIANGVGFEGFVRQVFCSALPLDPNANARIRHVDAVAPAGCQDPVLEYGLRHPSVHEDARDGVFEGGLGATDLAVQLEIGSKHADAPPTLPGMPLEAFVDGRP